MFWLIVIGIAIVFVFLLLWHENMENKVPSDNKDLSEEDIEYDYLQRMEQEQEEEDEYWLEQQNK